MKVQKPRQNHNILNNMQRTALYLVSKSNTGLFRYTPFQTAAPRRASVDDEYMKCIPAYCGQSGKCSSWWCSRSFQPRSRLSCAEMPYAFWRPCRTTLRLVSIRGWYQGIWSPTAGKPNKIRTFRGFLPSKSPWIMWLCGDLMYNVSRFLHNDTC